MKRLKIFGIIVFVLVVAHAAITLHLKSELQHELAAIRAKGGPMSVADFNKPSVPDAENAFTIYRKVFPYIRDERFGTDVDTLVAYRKDPSLKKQANAAAKRLQPLALLLEQADSKPKCQFPVTWEKGTHRLDFSQYANMRRLTLLICGLTYYEASRGNTKEAVRLMDEGLRSSKAMLDSPLLIGHLVSVALVTIHTSNLQNIVNICPISESQARELSDSLARFDYYSSYRNVVLEERVLELRRFEHPEVTRISDGTKVDEHPVDYYARTLILKSWFWRPFLYADEMSYLKQTEKRSDLANLTTLELKKRGRSLENSDTTTVLLTTRGMSTQKVYSRTALSRDKAAAMIAGSRIMLGLIAYKDHFGAYPASLADLRTKLKWETPKDPFSGKDFIYKRQDNGFVLYGFGENMNDDHAQSYLSDRAPSNATYHMPDGRSSADMIWQMNH